MKTIEPAISQAVTLYMRGHTRAQVRGKLECCTNSDGEALTRGEIYNVLTEAEKRAGMWRQFSHANDRRKEAALAAKGTSDE